MCWELEEYILVIIVNSDIKTINKLDNIYRRTMKKLWYFIWIGWSENKTNIKPKCYLYFLLHRFLKIEKLSKRIYFMLNGLMKILKKTKHSYQVLQGDKIIVVMKLWNGPAKNGNLASFRLVCPPSRKIPVFILHFTKFCDIKTGTISIRFWKYACKQQLSIKLTEHVFVFLWFWDSKKGKYYLVDWNDLHFFDCSLPTK